MGKTDFYTHPRAMEPLFPSQNEGLIDLAMDVHRKAAGLGGSLQKITRSAVADLLRHINSYYSSPKSIEYSKMKNWLYPKVIKVL